MNIVLRPMTVTQQRGKQTFQVALGRSEILDGDERIGYVEESPPHDVSLIRDYPKEYCESVTKEVGRLLSASPNYTKAPTLINGDQ